MSYASDQDSDWILISSIPVKSIVTNSLDWTPVLIVIIGLSLLLLINVVSLLTMNKQLRIKAAEAAISNRAKTDFLSTMSHDIRTPMNAIIGMTSLAMKDLNDKEAVSGYLHKMSLASNHLLTLINDILDISKIESGSLKLNAVPSSLTNVIENLVSITQPMASDKKIDLRFYAHHIVHEKLVFDQLRLNQVFINLVSNALKYTGENGHVTVSWTELPCEEDAGKIKLDFIVSDTGIGMTKEFMKAMYTPFSREVDSRVNRIQGTGLGLAITKQMVDLMGGTIECDSTVGEGTTFHVHFTFTKASDEECGQFAETKQILLFDSDPQSCDYRRETLERIGAQVLSARDKTATLDLLRSNQQTVDAVLMNDTTDGLPDLASVQAIRSAIPQHVPIILVTPIWPDIEAAARQAGADGAVSPPLLGSALINALSDMLDITADVSAQEEENAGISGTNILIAEDNDTNWEIISELLSCYDVSSERAENGRLLLERLNTMKPGEFDLIFMDIQMPEMNGIEATKAIRNSGNAVYGQIPIYAMTADAFSEDVTACLNAGMNGHIAKPVDMKQVLNAIKEVKEEQNHV